jgi:D-alanine-D-alanine ligase-like ATP-grasp enzyme
LLESTTDNGNDLDVYEIINTKIVPIIELTIKSIESKMYKSNCFEIFGYDFMLDNKLTPWLIEVNTNPCLEESSDILKMFLPRMLDDAFKLTIDVLFPPKNKDET